MAKTDGEIPLKRTLNLIQTIFLGVGTAICGTMFAIMGRAVETAGPSIVIIFLIGAFFALLDGLMLHLELLYQVERRRSKLH